MNNQYDVVVFGAHPDDVELSAGGTVAKMVSQGLKVVLVDLTQGELGTRGTAEIRKKEAKAAAEILGVDKRINLNLKDGFFQCDEASLLEVVKVIRQYKPRIVIANAIDDRHPDHGKGAELVVQASFLSGLVKCDTGEKDPVHRPDAVYHYIQDYNRDPDVVVDISDFVDQKMNAILAYSSQFFDKNSSEPETPISSPEFLQHIKGRHLSMGRPCGFTAGEGFEVTRPVGVNSLLDLL
jgi:bacillithiol biosynthesis deacetylase BshB1